MDSSSALTSFAPIAAVLDAAYSVVSGVVDALTPLLGAGSTAAAIILITMLVRSALMPVAVSQVRAEIVRRRLAPRLRELQKKHRTDPDRLRRETAGLYAAEKASPLAGCLPALLQAPVLSTVYGLFALASVNGHSNALLAADLFGAPLGISLAHFVPGILGGSALVGSGAVWPGLAVFATLLTILAVTSFLSRRRALNDQAASALSMGTPDDAAPSFPQQAAVTRALSFLPFLSVVFAAFVPLAATLYLAVSASWTLAERAIIHHTLGRRSPH